VFRSRDECSSRENFGSIGIQQGHRDVYSNVDVARDEMGRDGMDRYETRDGGEQPGIDWAQSVRLGVIASVIAALVAVALVGHVAEQTIIVSVIVLATMASWFQIEQPHHRTRERAHVRTSRR
jgi:Flp pilus assembly protein TadB